MRKSKFIRKKHSGRNFSGSVTVRHKGGEHKRFLRVVDLKRDKIGIEGKVVSIEYDPNRNAEIALVWYKDGEKRYILSPLGLKIGDSVASGKNAEVKTGNALPLNVLPLGTVVHNIELKSGRGGQLARGAGTYATIVAKEGEYVDLKLPSSEIRKVRGECFATVGAIGNTDAKNKILRKAGTKIHLGIRPTVRGVAQNPRSHPHGGGEGRSGIGMSTPKRYSGTKAVGKTRKKQKYSNKYIIQRRKK